MSKRPLRHLGQVDFNMFVVTKVVFLLVEYAPFDW